MVDLNQFWISLISIGIPLLIPIIFYLMVQNYKRTSYWKKRNIVYLPATPLFSKNIFDSFLIRYSLLSTVYKHGKGNVCCGFFQFRKPALLIRSPHVINLVLNQEFRIFQNKRQSDYTEGNKDPLSQHLLALNGYKWKFLRAKLTPTFTSEKLKSMFSLLEICVQNFLSYIDESKDSPIDIMEICGKLSIDAIASCAFGLELQCLKNRNHDFIKMGKAAFRPGNWHMFKAHLRTLYPQLFKKFNIRAYGKDVNDFFCSLVSETIRRRRMSGEKRVDFIYLLMKMLEEDEATVTEFNRTSTIKFTDDLIAAQAFSFFIGGYETTSITMSCIFYELACHDEIRQKVQNEIDSNLSSESEISYNDLKSLEYLDMVIKEVLRLHPPAFYTQRICSEDFKIPGSDVTIVKDMEVYIPILELHSDEENFPRPLEFIPERFSRENKSRIPKGSYLPFGDGPRKCIGMRFSLMELKLVMAITMLKYDFHLEKKTPEHINLEEYSRIYKIKNKIFLKFTKRVIS
ncbi:unnamed protein product [Nezara viridula]|uniref:Cytochrome P450 n=1 Tax=Nezara viridula TaxID=85310 RepID=A0A9P0MSE2_NEZVI|nr:unnamed protein product [Nezara viridula]